MPAPEVAFPCGSASTSRTRFPQLAMVAARFTAVVVLPTPPFWFATAIILAIYPAGAPLKCFTCPAHTITKPLPGMFHVSHLRAFLLCRKENQQGGESTGRQTGEPARFAEGLRTCSVEALDNLVRQTTYLRKSRLVRDSQRVMLIETSNRRFLGFQIARVKVIGQYEIQIRFGNRL